MKSLIARLYALNNAHAGHDCNAQQCGERLWCGINEALAAFRADSLAGDIGLMKHLEPLLADGLTWKQMGLVVRSVDAYVARRESDLATPAPGLCETCRQSLRPGYSRCATCNRSGR